MEMSSKRSGVRKFHQRADDQTTSGASRGEGVIFSLFKVKKRWPRSLSPFLVVGYKCSRSVFQLPGCLVNVRRSDGDVFNL